MAHVTVQGASVDLECPALHATDFRVIEVPFLHGVVESAAHLRLHRHCLAAREAEIFVANGSLAG